VLNSRKLVSRKYLGTTIVKIIIMNNSPMSTRAGIKAEVFSISLSLLQTMYHFR